MLLKTYTQLLLTIYVTHSRNDLHHIFSYFIHIHSMQYKSCRLSFLRVNKHFPTFKRFNESNRPSNHSAWRSIKIFTIFFSFYTIRTDKDPTIISRVFSFSRFVSSRDINMAEYQRNFCINLQIILYTSQKPLCIPSPTRRDETTDDISRLKKRRAYVHNPSLGFSGVEASCTQNWHASRVARKFSTRFQVDGHRGAVKGIWGAFWCKGKWRTIRGKRIGRYVAFKTYLLDEFAFNAGASVIKFMRIV